MNDVILILLAFVLLINTIILLIFKLFVWMDKKNINSKLGKINSDYFFRDIPCFKSIDIAYWLLYKYSNINKNQLNSNLIGTYLLKWYQNNNIDIINNKHNNYVFDLKDGNFEKNKVESIIYDFLKKVSGNNNILEKNEIKHYCIIYSNEVYENNIFNNILNSIQEDLEKDKKIYLNVEGSSASEFAEITLSDTLMNEFKNLMGLKNFLRHYSNMGEKEYVEVHLWEEYLIFANLLGIAKKLQKQYKKIYPTRNFIDFTFESQNETCYNKFKYIECLLILIIVILIVLNFFYIEVRIDLFATIILIIPPSYILYICIINTKVKEMTESTYGKITSRIEKNDISESTESFSVKQYCGEYEVNNKTYKFTFLSNRFLENGEKIKIYYNSITPEKYELEGEHYIWKISFAMIAIFYVLGILFLIYFCNL